MNRALILLAAAGAVAFAQTPCEQLQSLKLPDTTITMAMTVAAGAFQNPGAPAGPATPAVARTRQAGKRRRPRRPGSGPQMLPAYCRVSATLKPSSDSDIKIEVWLPDGRGLERQI